VDLGPVSIDSPEHADAEDVPAVAYSRPHEIEIERFSPGLSGIPVQLNRVLMVGPTARLELEREDSPQIIEAELPAERARHLRLRQGETLLIRPNRMQVFVERGRGASAAREVAARAAEVPPEPLPAFGTVIW
jgi:sulfate transport system ATP-binding protein